MSSVSEECRAVRHVGLDREPPRHDVSQTDVPAARRTLEGVVPPDDSLVHAIPAAGAVDRASHHVQEVVTGQTSLLAAPSAVGGHESAVHALNQHGGPGAAAGGVRAFDADGR